MQLGTVKNWIDPLEFTVLGLSTCQDCWLLH